MHLRYYLGGLLSLLLASALYAQAPLSLPMDQEAFDLAIQQLEAERFEAGRLATANVLIDKNYLTADQVQVLIQTFAYKSNQEAIAKQAYAKIYDPNNFYKVYSAFTFEESRAKLRNWVKRQNMPQESKFGLPEPLSEAEFAQAYTLIQNENFDTDRFRIAQQLIDNNYLTSDQVYDLVDALSFKNNQDQIARQAYRKTYDQQNYHRVLDAFVFSASKRSLSNWLKGQAVIDRSVPNEPTITTWEDPYDDNDNLDVAIRYNTVDRGAQDQYDTQPPNRDRDPVDPMIVTDGDFVNIQRQLSTIPSDQDRLIRAKQISDQANWTAEQVRDLMDMLVFENMRLDFAMYAYQKTMDVQNYYLVYDGLNSAEDQQRLIDYVTRLDGSLDNAASTTNRRPNSLYNHHINTVNNTPQVITTDNPDLPQPASPEEWADALNHVQSFSSDDDRLAEAKRILDNKPATTAQVLDLMNLLLFDALKLDLAQYAYDTVLDPEEYGAVVEQLKNEQDQEALLAYMEERR